MSRNSRRREGSIESRSDASTSTFTPEPAKEKRGFKTQFSRSSGHLERSERKWASGTAGCLRRGSECLDQRKYQLGWPAHSTSSGSVKEKGSSFFLVWSSSKIVRV